MINSAGNEAGKKVILLDIIINNPLTFNEHSDNFKHSKICYAQLIWILFSGNNNHSKDSLQRNNELCDSNKNSDKPL